MREGLALGEGTPRRGVTLLELLVSLILLSLVGSVAVPAIRAVAPAPADSPQRRLSNARRIALVRGEAMTIDWAGSDGKTRPVTIWPDGHITADSSPGVEAVTGLPDTLIGQHATTSSTMPSRAPR